MLVAFARYSKDTSFTVLAANKTFVLAMAAGSIIGTAAGGAPLGVVPSAVLTPLLALLLMLSARKSGSTAEPCQRRALLPRSSGDGREPGL